MVTTLANSPAPAWLYVAAWIFCIALAWAVTAASLVGLLGWLNDRVDNELIGMGCFFGFCFGGAFSVILPVMMVVDVWFNR